MTSNERKILECIWNHGGETHIYLIGKETGFSGDYSYFLCCALKNAGHLELSGHTFCRLSEKGRQYFEGDQSGEDENIEEAKKDQEVLSGPAVQQEEDIDKEPEELLSNEDGDENKDDENAVQETEENASGNDVDIICISMTEHDEEEPQS